MFNGRVRLQNGVINAFGNCFYCRKEHSVNITIKEFLDWQTQNMHIQEALKSVSSEDREFLVSGICPTCWRQVFPVEELDI